MFLFEFCRNESYAGRTNKSWLFQFQFVTNLHIENIEISNFVVNWMNRWPLTRSHNDGELCLRHCAHMFRQRWISNDITNRASILKNRWHFTILANETNEFEWGDKRQLPHTRLNSNQFQWMCLCDRCNVHTYICGTHKQPSTHHQNDDVCMYACMYGARNNSISNFFFIRK